MNKTNDGGSDNAGCGRLLALVKDVDVRTLLAGMAMQGMVGKLTCMVQPDQKDIRMLAENAVRCADALLKELEK